MLRVYAPEVLPGVCHIKAYEYTFAFENRTLYEKEVMIYVL